MLEGREWQLQQMREGFREGRSMVADFLELLPPGPARRRLICGQTVTTEQLLQHITFDKDYDTAPKKFKNQPKLIREVLSQLTDEDSQKLFRMATGLNSIPSQDCTITFVYKDTQEIFPTFSTCYRQVRPIDSGWEKGAFPVVDSQAGRMPCFRPRISLWRDNTQTTGWWYVCLVGMVVDEQVFMPYYGKGQQAMHEMLQKLRHSIHPLNLAFDEG